MQIISSVALVENEFFCIFIMFRFIKEKQTHNHIFIEAFFKYEMLIILEIIKNFLRHIFIHNSHTNVFRRH